MRCWQTWHCKKATKGSLKPQTLKLWIRSD
jgi:hypothetical protein